MKIGVCVGNNTDNAQIAKAIGYDYIETNCQSIASMKYDELDALKEIGIPIFSANCFIGLRVVGPNKNEKEINNYLDEMFKKADYLGIKILVFGSSGARKILDSEPPMTVDEARSQVADFLRDFVAPRCEQYRISCAIEPLRKGECNIINTVKTGIDICKIVNNPYIKVLADVKHMYEENDPLNALSDYGEYIIHAHTSNPTPDPSLNKKRTYPCVGDLFNQDLFFKPLIAAGVKQCSVEADVISFKDDALAAFDVLKKYR